MKLISLFKQYIGLSLMKIKNVNAIVDSSDSGVSIWKKNLHEFVFFCGIFSNPKKKAKVIELEDAFSLCTQARVDRFS